MTLKAVLPPCRGLYLTAIFYKDDNILVTHEDQIPVVEIDDTYSCLLMQDFFWFTKVGGRGTLCLGRGPGMPG